EYTFMSPASRVTQLIGTSIYAVTYGVVRTAVIFGVISLFFDMDLSNANYFSALLILFICSISLVGFGMVSAVMPLLSPEKGQQVTSIFTAVLLLVSGVYYSVDVLPGWMQPIAKISPVTYALDGMRGALLDGKGVGDLWGSIWPLLIMGALLVPAGLLIFRAGERYAKRVGLLKRSG
ncbi:MAG: ABC transporter permease, partial [Thermomicrobiales bacterium]